MRKSMVFVLGVVLVVPIVQAQSAKTNPKMGLEFTTAALKSLRLISGYEDHPEQKSGGSIVASREVIDSLENASDLARSSGELQTVGVLRSFLQAKIENNSSRDYIVLVAWMKWNQENAAGEAYTARMEKVVKADTLANSPLIADMQRREQACFDAADSMIRAGAYFSPRACLRVVVSVESVFPPSSVVSR